MESSQKKKLDFEVFKENVTIEKLRSDESKICISTSSPDFISYPEFLKYFSDLITITKHNVIIGINFTYGWMPTIFNFRSNNFDDVVQILNRAKQGLVPTKEELASLAHCFNNSLVGTSKLLHFINPEKFAIWDSRVYRYLTGESPHTYRLNKSEAYLDYLDFCAYLTKQNGFEEIHKSLEKKIGYKMTKMRVVELIMYIKEI